MEIVYLIIGVVVGGVVAYLLTNQKKKGVESTLMLTAQRLDQEEKKNESLVQAAEKAEEKFRSLADELTQARIDVASLQTQVEAEREHNSKTEQMRREQFQEQLRTVQEQFQNLATRVLNQTSDQLKTQNTESMQTLTAPLKQNLEQLQQEQTSRISETATRLTNVMRGGNKIQGNWGEVTLKNLLESQGLKLGRDFDLQHTITDEQGNAVLNDESGAKMVPDAILHYPNDEDVVIDAKMSIDAYAKYVETEDETQRKALAKEVVRSVKEQFKRLSSKEYNRYVKPPRRSVDFVIMYIPYEGALQLALATEPGLWNEAFSKKIFITGQQNLMAILTMIHAAWRQFMQNENEKQVFIMAEELLKRVGAFIKEFDQLKEHLRRATTDCEQLEQKYDGRMGIVQKANQLKKLGVKENVKYPIPSLEEEETQPQPLPEGGEADMS